MPSPIEVPNDAMECLRLAQQATASRHKALLMDLAQAWILLSEQVKHLHRPNPDEAPK